jgi:hypothetical protein
MEKILNNQVVECNENLQGGKIKFQSTFILGNKQKLVDIILSNNKQVYQLFYN